MIDIFDKLNAAYGDQTLADSDQIKDKKFGKKQDVLNKEILDPDDPNSLKSKVDSFNGIVIDPDNVVSTDKSDIEVGSSKIPTGNAVAGALSDAMLKAGVFDISAYNLTNGQPTPYADLEAALGNNGENVPEAVRKGGMQVKFIQGSVGSSDNKYVQYRYVGTEVTGTPNPFLNVNNWRGVVNVPVAGNLDQLLVPVNLQIGKVVAPKDTIVDNGGRACIEDYIELESIDTIVLSDNTDFNYIAYDEHKVRLLNSDWLNVKHLSKSEIYESDNTIKYVRFNFRKHDDSYLYPTDELWVNIVADGAKTPSFDNDILAGSRNLIRGGALYGLQTLKKNLTVTLGKGLSGYSTITIANRACTEDFIPVDNVVSFMSNVAFSVSLYRDNTKGGRIDGIWNDPGIIDIKSLHEEHPDYKYFRVNFKKYPSDTVFNEDDYVAAVATIDKTLENIDAIGIDIEQPVIESKLDYSLLTTNSKRINIDGTTPAASSARNISDFIAVQAGQVVAVKSVVDNVSLVIAGYSSNNVSSFVDGIEGIDDTNAKWYRYIVPAGVNYILVSGKTDNPFYGVIQSAESRIDRVENIINSNIGDLKKLVADALDITYDGAVISDYTNEQMTQVPSAVYLDNGYLYTVYYGRADGRQESPHPSVKIKLVKTNICNPGSDDRQHIVVLSSNDVVGDFHQSDSLAPYDPQVMEIGNSIRCIMVGCVYDSSIPPTDNRPEVHECQLIARDVNKENLALGETIYRLTLAYQYNGETVQIPMKRTELGIFVDRRLGREEGYSYFGMPTISYIHKIIDTNNITWYYAYLGGFLYGAESSQDPLGHGYCGTLIRSNDGVSWEEVSTPVDYTNVHGITDIFEGAIGIEGDYVYLTLRASLPTGGNIHGKPCAVFGYYNMTTGTWSAPIEMFPWVYDGCRNFNYIRHEYEIVGNTKVAKPYLYVLTDIGPCLWTQAGFAIRTNMAVTKFNIQNGIPVKIDTLYLKSMFGFTYPIVVRAGAGEYLICAENRRFDYNNKTGRTSYDPIYPSSDIVCKPIKFFKPMYILDY